MLERWEKRIKNWHGMVLIGVSGVVWPTVGLVLAIHDHERVALSLIALMWFFLSGVALFTAGYFFNERVRRLGTRGGVFPYTRRPPGV